MCKVNGTCGEVQPREIFFVHNGLMYDLNETLGVFDNVDDALLFEAVCNAMAVLFEEMDNCEGEELTVFYDDLNEMRDRLGCNFEWVNQNDDNRPFIRRHELGATGDWLFTPLENQKENGY